jgi:hypothetical protein
VETPDLPVEEHYDFPLYMLWLLCTTLMSQAKAHPHSVGFLKGVSIGLIV